MNSGTQERNREWMHGCVTALITPFTPNGERTDWEALKLLTNFQIQEEVTGILYVGTTGESSTLDHDEHAAVVEMGVNLTDGKCFCVAGTGSNNTAEAKERAMHAAEKGTDALLLVDPYYNGPSSLEIRREYLEPVAKACPDTIVIPYPIPGRTGCQLLPADIALAWEKYPNIMATKDATGNFKNMRLTRQLCGPNFAIWSGDDDKTLDMILDPQIQACGAISVIANIAPRAVSGMVQAAREGEIKKAKELYEALSPLFQIVTIKTREEVFFCSGGKQLVDCRARNPLPIKTAMAILGIPVGPCRAPLGKVTEAGFIKIFNALYDVWHKNPEILKPVDEFFGLDIGARLSIELNHWRDKGLFYTQRYNA